MNSGRQTKTASGAMLEPESSRREASFLGRGSRDFWVRMVAGGLLISALAVTWWELLFVPLGASHDGRINGRFGLIVRNFAEKGWAGSDFGADISPFSTVPYTHHPPLLNVIQNLTGWLFGLGEWQLHLAGYVSGLVTVAAVLWLTQELNLRAGGAVAAVVAVAFTPMFWIYARLGLGVVLPVLLLALWYRMERSRVSFGGGRQRAVLLAAGGLTALASWMGAVLVLLVSGWGALDYRFRRIAALLAAVGSGALVLTWLWIVQAGTVGELTDHIAGRLDPPGAGEFIEQYRWFYGTLYPWWVRWMILPALVAALWSARTRLATVWMLGSLGIWTLAAPQAAYVHDFWTFPLIVPVILGLAVILEGVAGLWERHLAARFTGWVKKFCQWAPVVVLYVLLLAYAVGGWTDFRDAYFRAPSDAGALLRSVTPPVSQTAVWMAPGVDAVSRWASFYWDLPVERYDPPTVSQIGDEELVLVCLNRVSGGRPLARQGRYGLFTAAQLAEMTVPITNQPCGS